MFFPINIWAEWPGQTEEEYEAQESMWNTASDGKVAFLCEYRGQAPFPSQWLVPEGFLSDRGAFIPASVLRERLALTLRLAAQAEQNVYGTRREKRRRFADHYKKFVDRCEEVQLQTGTPALIITQQDGNSSRAFTMFENDHGNCRPHD